MVARTNQGSITVMKKVPGQAGKSAGGSRPALGALTPRKGWDGGARGGPSSVVPWLGTGRLQGAGAWPC